MAKFRPKKNTASCKATMGFKTRESILAFSMRYNAQQISPPYVPKFLPLPLAQAKNGDKQLWK
jgi:hypothetical protein